MKNLFLYFLIVISSAASAQMGMGNGMNGGGMNGMGGGMGRGMSNQQIPQSESKPEKIDYIKVSTDKLEKDLGLDTLQKAIIKQAFEEGQFRMQSILDSKISEEMKELKIAEIRENTDKRILKVLNKTQTEKYIKLKEKAKKN